MISLRSKYKTISLLTAIMFLMSSAAPAIAQCGMLLSGDCTSEASAESAEQVIPPIFKSESESSCCTPQPEPMDCHGTDAQNDSSDTGCENCDCGYTTSDSKTKSATVIPTNHDVVTLAEHHVSYAYVHSALPQTSLAELPLHSTPPIYLLVSSFLI